MAAEIDMVEVQASFDRTDKIIAFKKELIELIKWRIKSQ